MAHEKKEKIHQMIISIIIIIIMNILYYYLTIDILIIIINNFLLNVSVPVSSEVRKVNFDFSASNTLKL